MRPPAAVIAASSPESGSSAPHATSRAALGPPPPPPPPPPPLRASRESSWKASTRIATACDTHTRFQSEHKKIKFENKKRAASAGIATRASAPCDNGTGGPRNDMPEWGRAYSHTPEGIAPKTFEPGGSARRRHSFASGARLGRAGQPKSTMPGGGDDRNLSSGSKDATEGGGGGDKGSTRKERRHRESGAARRVVPEKPSSGAPQRSAMRSTE